MSIALEDLHGVQRSIEINPAPKNNRNKPDKP
jgi:hypothetical protein